MQALGNEKTKNFTVLGQTEARMLAIGTEPPPAGILDNLLLDSSKHLSAEKVSIPTVKAVRKAASWTGVAVCISGIPERGIRDLGVC